MAVDKSGALPSVIEPVVDRNRRWSPVWYPWIKRLLDTIRTTSTAVTAVETDVSTLTTTVNGNTASITTLTTSVDGLGAQWGVTINVNGRITGAVRLDSGATSSTFAVLADKFIVVHPSANGTTIQAFIVGLVNGVSTIGVNGNLLVDGTVIARTIGASAITTDKLDAGAVTAAKISAGAIETDKLAASAVTADKIAAGTITADKLAVTSLSAIAANVGTVTAGVLRSSDSKFKIDLTNKTLTIET